MSTEPPTKQAEVKPRQRRGFAAMSADKQRQIAGMGGKAAHVKGTAHEYTAKEAKAAGRKGGQTAQAKRRAAKAAATVVQSPNEVE